VIFSKSKSLWLQDEPKEKAWMKGAAGKTAANDDDNAFASLAKPKAKKVVMHTFFFYVATRQTLAQKLSICETF
jgi:hypothetical protein